MEGALVLPVGYKKGQRVPLIVEPHGGPMGVRTVAFNPVWQMLAGAGYAVLAPNFRGSGNYGREFVRANIGDLVGGDYRDILAGVDELIKKGIADKTKLGVEGWSYGGFMTNWIITHTDRFKAAVSSAGLSNLGSFYGTTDIKGFMEYYHKGFPWISREIYGRSSPLASTFKVKTPVLILHGEADTRVPISQSEELYYYLKKTGVTVKFVRYPREPHGLREPNHQLSRYTRMLNWFNTYILGKEKQGLGSYFGNKDVANLADDIRNAQAFIDTWFGRFLLGCACLEAEEFSEAYSEFEKYLKRRGEATSVHFKDLPTYRYLPPVYYYLGRAQEGLKSPAASDSYETFLLIKEKGDGDWMVENARQRLNTL